VEPVFVQQRRSPGAAIEITGAGTIRLEIPPGPANRLRLAQIDDYTGLSRAVYPWHPPVDLSLRARTGSAEVPGTWGFGFWNAPTSFSLGLGRSSPFPALPEAAWFFQASPASHLSFRDDLPGNGWLAQTFRRRALSAGRSLQALAALPLLIFPPAARRFRRFVSRKLIRESGASLAARGLTNEHEYGLSWLAGAVSFRIDGETVHETEVVPRAPLALVIWIDNQYAAFSPGGRLRYGLHASAEPHHLEISAAEINGRPLRLAATEVGK
jgi:hypothetical protein